MSRAVKYRLSTDWMDLEKDRELKWITGLKLLLRKKKSITASRLKLIFI